jgi:hypothetical protein
MIFHEIDMTGKFYAQEVDALPTWTSSDKRRLLYLNTTGVYYVGGNTDWEAITTGGNNGYLSRITADTHIGTITPSADNSIDLGAIALRYANVYAVNFQGTTTTATYADLAEKYTTDQVYPVGTLMTITENEEFEMSATENTWDVVTGVVSDKPGFVMNADSVGQEIGQVGKTPIRVIGPTVKGGYLMNAGNGCAKMTSGTTDMIAIALESNDESDEKLVMSYLKL